MLNWQYVWSGELKLCQEFVFKVIHNAHASTGDTMKSLIPNGSISYPERTHLMFMHVLHLHWWCFQLLLSRNQSAMFEPAEFVYTSVHGAFEIKLCTVSWTPVGAKDMLKSHNHHSGCFRVYCVTNYSRGWRNSASLGVWADWWDTAFWIVRMAPGCGLVGTAKRVDWPQFHV